MILSSPREHAISSVPQSLCSLELQSVQPKAYLCTAPFNQPKTGNYDYVSLLGRTLNDSGFPTQHISSEHLSGDIIVREILENMRDRTGSPQVFNLFLDAGKRRLFTGQAMLPSHLKTLKEQGLKVVVTAIEFGKPVMQKNEVLLGKLEEYFKVATQVIFVDESDRMSAVNCFPDNEGVQNSSVIRIPNTIALDFSRLPLVTEREGNFLCFGILREGKGIEGEVVELAKQLKEQNKSENVLIVASPLSYSPSTKNNSMNVLRVLLSESYPSYRSEICSEAELEGLMYLYQSTLVHLSPVMNIEFHFNLSDTELFIPFSRCSFALNFHSRGLSTHFSSVVNTLLADMPSFGRKIPHSETRFVSDADTQFQESLGIVYSQTLSDSEVAKLVIERSESFDFSDFLEKKREFLRRFPLDMGYISNQFLEMYTAQ